MKNGAVIFLDALGTKGIWTRADPKEVFSSWRSVLAHFDRAIARFSGTHEIHDLSVRAFSDTVIVTAVGADPYQLLVPIAEVLSTPFFIALMEKVYLRGVISLGDFYESDQLVIGPAVDEAADWYERPDWIGVSAAPTMAFCLESFVGQGGDLRGAYTRYAIPMNDGTREPGWALSWHDRLYQTEKAVLDAAPDFPQLRGLVLNNFASRPIGRSAYSKYKHTLEFLDSVRT
jgi:hypothetical protein